MLQFKSIFTFLVLVAVFIFSEKLLSYSEGKLYGENIIYTHTTPYQRIVMTHNKNDYRLYLNNNLQFSSADEYRYHEALVHPTMAASKSIRNVLVLGGGDGLAVREILKYSEVEHVTLVDLDEGMTKLFQQNEVLTKLNQSSLTQPKVKVINADAYVWARNCHEKFDAVIVDFPDPSNYSLGKLYSVNFYRTLSRIMTEDAIAVIQTTSPYFAPKSFWCINKTTAQIFPKTDAYHVYVPSFGEWGYTIVSKNPSANFSSVKRKINGLKFYDYDFNNLHSFSKDMIRNDVEINRLDNQILVRYFDEEWGKL